MKRIFSSPFAALAAGLGLRLFFVLKFPANSGDTVLYEQIATNWLKHGTYAMNVGGAVTPVDLRMPGYPAYLALVYWLTGRTGDAARIFVMLGQVAADLAGSVFIVWLASSLLVMTDKHARQGPVLRAAWWMAMLCPFTANYTAVPLTETFAIALTAIALVFVVGLSGSADDRVHPKPRKRWEWGNDYQYWAIPAGLAVGVATLFRPESPLLLGAAWIVTGLQLVRGGRIGVWARIVACSGLACLLPLTPWAVRNFVTLHEVQFLAPKNSNLPGELVPYGFMAWEKTWLYRISDCYLVPWKLDDEAIDVDSIPARAFDTPEEKRRVAAILETYNNDLTLTPEEDATFGQLARERNARHPLRTYLWLPAARAVTIWFTPRIELLPVSGNVFPLLQNWYDDRLDQSVTAGFFLLNIVYVGLGVWGAVRLWRWNAAVWHAVALLAVFVLLRTAFLTTLETPEPRYVLVCFPALIALAAQVFARPFEAS
jgi:hypothetical protein